MLYFLNTLLKQTVFVQYLTKLNNDIVLYYITVLNLHLYNT